MLIFLIVGGIAYAVVMLFAVSLCMAAKNGDRMMAEMIIPAQGTVLRRFANTH